MGRVPVHQDPDGARNPPGQMSWLIALAGWLPLSLIKRVSRLQWRHPLLKRLFERAAERFRHQDGRIGRGAGRGLLINAGASHAGYLLGTSEPLVQEVFENSIGPGMTVYDVGADAGFLTLIAARLVGSRGAVVSFEPLEANARQIEHNARLNGFSHIRVRREALGREDRQARFLVSSVSSWGRLDTCGPPGSQVGEITVPLRRMDSVVEDEALPVPDLIKIDVEGAEVDVLSGAQRLLRRARPLLLIEVHGTNKLLAEIIKSLDYEGRVLGGAFSVEDCPWSAHVLAAPIERGFPQGASPA